MRTYKPVKAKEEAKVDSGTLQRVGPGSKMQVEYGGQENTCALLMGEVCGGDAA